MATAMEVVTENELLLGWPMLVFCIDLYSNCIWTVSPETVLIWKQKLLSLLLFCLQNWSNVFVFFFFQRSELKLLQPAQTYFCVANITGLIFLNYCNHRSIEHVNKEFQCWSVLIGGIWLWVINPERGCW